MQIMNLEKFLDKVKQSPFKNSVIIAATGDHRVREMSMDLFPKSFCL